MPNARLEVVDLSNNCITYFGDWSFNPRLRILKLGGNLLTSLRGDISRNVFLRHLDLSNNRLTRLAELPSTLFVEELLVANNRLTSLEGLESFGQLTTLDVHGNLLKWLHPVCAETHPHLMYVDVGANPEFGDVRLLTPLAGSRLLCSINLFPGPFEEVKWLRIKIIHMLTHLEFLNGEPVTSEEKVEVEEVYGAELSEQRQVWERLLPGEAFLDRRVLKAHELN
ncbi:leucine rich repeat-containing protein [Cystoisospora suis]|uniref:Leucine rich repeat-containing protein n=1 Tax=Cystoisospora suis TaxID=483139 RepID=A0A2C6KJI4_9APIC|nr:leucine rich repeat-containing protein [Cystoisospora suis]